MRIAAVPDPFVVQLSKPFGTIAEEHFCPNLSHAIVVADNERKNGDWKEIVIRRRKNFKHNKPIAWKWDRHGQEWTPIKFFNALNMGTKPPIPREGDLCLFNQEESA